MTRWLSYLLIILVATQSVLAMADIHQAHQRNQTHQSDVGHRELAADTAQNEKIIKNVKKATEETVDDLADLKKTPLNAIDCQHCCHCHGSQSNLLSDAYTQLEFDGNKPARVSLRAVAPSSQPSSLYRPPRA